MELASTSASLGAHISFPKPQLCFTSRTLSPSLFSVRNSFPESIYLGSNFQGSYLPLGTNKLHEFVRATAVGDTSTVQCDSVEEHIANTKPSDLEACNESTTSTDEETEKKDSAKNLDDEKMTRVCDKLIEVFMVDKPTPTDWRRLLAFSREWDSIRPHFYQRCQDRANGENDPGMKHKILRLSRKLKEVDEDVQRHEELLKLIRKSPSAISEIVAKRRKDFTQEFFVHLHAVAESYYDNPTEQNEIKFMAKAETFNTYIGIDVAKLGNMCLAAVQTYDTATESIEALNAAELKFQDIINSPSVDAACRKIDSLAEKNQLDSALVLMITKAWSAAKESSMTKDEVKDVLYHLYMTARGNLQRLVPKEIRILKYLLTIEDPEERMSALKDAFTPGEELEGKDVDCLYTTPEQLYTWIGTVVDAYHFSREGTLVREARDLMSPKIVQKLEGLKKLVQDHFL